MKTADQSIVPDLNLPDGSPTEDAVRRAVDEGIRLFNDRNPLDARRMLESAVKLDRKSIIAWLNLGVACDALEDFDAARSAFRAAAGLHPDSAEAQHGLGLVAARTGDFERAELFFRNAIRLNPIAGYYNNLSILLRSLGRSKESDESLRKAVELSGDAVMHSNLLLGLFYTHGGDGARMRAEHDAWARRHADHLVERSPFDFSGRDLSPDRPLRIGYLSPDFRLHSVAFFFEPLLAAHDRTAVQVFCYSDARVPDEVTERIREKADVWREAHTLDDDALARRIMDDGIDILVDLAGHTGGNRLTVIARRVAPVQVSYLGYPGTTGLMTMDYRLTDGIADPIGAAEAFYSERLVRLPGGMLSYSGDQHAMHAPTPPSQTSGHLTFGTFNQLHKITDRMLRLWSLILERVPGSRLCIKAFGLADEGTREELRRRFTAHGADATRLALLSSEQSVASHLARYDEIDIGLDTFPYNGVTTTFEALWMGVPVVTLAGETHVTRMGATILTHVGLEELVAREEDEYVDKAVALARAPDRLADWRGSLRMRLATSSLCNAERLARAIEAAYRDMWRVIVSSSRSPDESAGRTQSN